MPMVGISSLRVSSKLEARDAKMNDDGEFSQLSGSITSTIQSLKKQILANRIVLVKEKIESNKKVTEKLSSQLLMLSKSRDANNSRNNEIKSPLTLRMESSLCKLGGLDLVGGDNEDINCQDDGLNASSTIIFGSNLGGKSIVRPIRIPMVQKIPAYTTWIFLDRNQIMAEDQSVVGRRRIYYDQNGSEALICSDSEEDPADEEDEKYDFSEGDDQMIQSTIQEHGVKEEVLESISQFFGVKLPEVQSRYEFLKQHQQKKQFVQNGDDETDVNKMPIGDIFVGKDLDSAMDSYDNLFCRRCLVFDCRLHGCSQPLVFPCEKQLPWSCSDEESRIPCGNNCYRLEHMKVEEAILSSSTGVASEDNRSLHGCKEGFKVSSRRKVSAPTDSKSTKIVQSESACSNDKQPNECSHVDTNVACDGDDNHDKENPIQRQDKKNGDTVNRNPKRSAEQVLASMRKKQRKIASDLGFSVTGGNSPADVRTKSRKASPKIVIGRKAKDMSNSRKSVGTENFDDNVDNWDEQADIENDKKIITEGDTLQSEVSSCKIEEAADCVSKLERTGWSEIEKSLYAKGLEIFGKNSCLIARNLLHGIKTCSEVAEYMNHLEFRQGKVECGTISRTESSGKGTEVRTRTRFWRRRGRVRRLKYTWKSAGHPSIRKRIADSKDQPCRQYTPCDCQSTCGKQCPCLRSGTCCEKYCGCSKVCKNRFRGCHCAKSQCRSRQCPCFAAGRECDPDVCRNCWVGCGDGTLGGPPQRGDNYECRNMKLLLKQQQRVLLGRSDVSGWGAFLKNSVNKHDYLGEYTGELISHREADKRGKIYDRENSSFLFNLNDQYVLDAYRKGDKLKFANHSPTPNCYAKVIMVAGDHRVGIFAKERICGGEELFYDYRYEPDKAPAWARKPEDSTAKRDDTTAASHGRAQKLAR